MVKAPETPAPRMADWSNRPEEVATSAQLLFRVPVLQRFTAVANTYEWTYGSQAASCSGNAALRGSSRGVSGARAGEPNALVWQLRNFRANSSSYLDEAAW